MGRPEALALAAMAGLLAACPIQPAADDDDLTSVDDDDGGPAIPDPSEGDESDGAWQPDRDHYTPETAWPCGTVTEAPIYLEATVPEGGAAFYVFEAGEDFSFDLQAFDAQSIVQDAHLHDGAGGSFGAEHTPTVPVGFEDEFGGQWVRGSWDVQAGQVYVLEILVPGGGFF